MTIALPKAVVLLSGGLDSATVLAIARRDGYAPYALSFRYGQRHSTELRLAQAIAKQMPVVNHTIIDIDLSVWGGSALTDLSLAVPKSDCVAGMSQEIPITYVPARNTIFLSFALGWAEVLGASDIFIGVNALDYSGYPDCRPEFIASFEQTANLATKQGVDCHQLGKGRPIKIRTPLIDLTKAEIIRMGLDLGVDYSQTLSCYDPVDSELACGHCDACLLRLRGFSQNNMSDPALYAV